jgi:uncharacterized membrane protein YqhA
MNKFLSSTRYIVVVGVLALLAASLTAFGWGVVKTVHAVGLVITSAAKDPGITIALIEVVDAFLIATAILIFAYGLYELFIADLSIPDWMQIHNLHDLKAKLAGVLVLVMAVKFLEKLVEWHDARETFFFALAITVISAALIAFSALGGKD